MCFYSKLSKKAIEVENRFKAKMPESNLFESSDAINGFAFPRTPVVTNKDRDTIKLFQWGLIPFWSKDKNIQKHTLNARVETLHEKPAFRSVYQNRCIIAADGFYEWQWLDDKGKKKQKHLIHIANNDIFTFAGIYSEWVDTETGELIPTYSIVTTEALGIMESIHNSKHRMPIILNPETEQTWLDGEEVKLFTNLQVDLIAEAI